MFVASHTQVRDMLLSFPVLVDTTTQSPWLRVWTAACRVPQDTTVRRRGSPECLENARLVSNSVCVFFISLPKIQSQESSLVSRLCPTRWSICLSGSTNSSKAVWRTWRWGVWTKHKASRHNISFIFHCFTLFSINFHSKNNNFKLLKGPILCPSSDLFFIRDSNGATSHN